MRSAPTKLAYRVIFHPRLLENPVPFAFIWSPHEPFHHQASQIGDIPPNTPGEYIYEKNRLVHPNPVQNNKSSDLLPVSDNQSRYEIFSHCDKRRSDEQRAKRMKEIRKKSVRQTQLTGSLNKMTNFSSFPKEETNVTNKKVDGCTCYQTKDLSAFLSGKSDVRHPNQPVNTLQTLIHECTESWRLMELVVLYDY
ncbi:hypothetical protein CBL_10355 [Carabus blaptoides fortunei]